MKRGATSVAQALQKLAARGELRLRRCVEALEGAAAAAPVVGGQRLLNFCSNDYLGLAGDARVAEAMARAARRWGAGSGAAHLVSGHSQEHHALEEELAEFTGRERALLFSTGYMANAGVIGAFAGRGEVVLGDRLNHASLIDGALQCGARLLRYRHADAEHAAAIAAEHGTKLALVVTDGVFSMDGDVAPLAGLAEVARRHSAWLMVDDAHGLGVLGARGRGSLEQAGLDAAQVPLLVGTLGKAFGSFGAFVAGDRDVVEYVMQRARSYLFTTALPPAVAAATRASLRIAREEGWRRTEVAARVAQFRAGAAQLGLALMESATPIQPVPVSGAAACMDASEALRKKGFWVSGIRHPTVPRGAERLRVTLSAAHTPAQVDALLAALSEVLRMPACDTQGGAA
ncbi:MAG: 8-amino-7-oxononanoate synthase [Pseudomonadota bacterium]|jgi:8-amino-7-oxononanoate synthase|nr:MAG: 8-amino-7-oxononanoate synthase [Pseudomonadota bacterium]